MRTLTRSSRQTRRVTVPTGFAWLKHLPPDEQANFISGLLQRVLAALKSEDWSPVAEWVEEWKATANVHADPQVARSVREGRAELTKGEAFDWDTLRKELGL